jgi:transposase
MTITATTRHNQPSTAPPTLFLAFALGVTSWQLACTTGAAQRPRERRVLARDIAAVREEMTRAQQRFGVPEAPRVVSCDEAGRDGCWLPRAWVAQGVEHGVVESSRLAVKRRSRRAKTARLDVDQLLTLLQRHAAGARQGWSVVRVPSVAAADRRQLHRARLTATRDRTRVSNRLQGRLASPGLTMPLPGACLTPLEHRRFWEGAAVPPGLWPRLGREGEHLACLAHPMAQLAGERQERLRSAADAATAPVRPLLTLKGMGGKSAWGFVRECCGWRALRSGKTVGALRGLTPTPHARGTMADA